MVPTITSAPLPLRLTLTVGTAAEGVKRRSNCSTMGRARRVGFPAMVHPFRIRVFPLGNGVLYRTDLGLSSSSGRWSPMILVHRPRWGSNLEEVQRRRPASGLALRRLGALGGTRN